VARLISLIRPENLPSCRVAEKNGMTVWKEVTRATLPHLVYAIQKEPAMENVTTDRSTNRLTTLPE
jgi:RimJ/RimL family protein N-acetyltransferase